MQRELPSSPGRVRGFGLCGKLSTMTHWYIIRILKEVVLIAAIVVAAVRIYQYFKKSG